MKRFSTSQLLQLPALTLVLLAMLLSGGGAASANTQAEAPALSQVAAQRCDGNRLIHEATHLYRMFYDQRYASEQRIATATNEYRTLYDPTYAAAQRMAAATDQYCADR